MTMLNKGTHHCTGLQKWFDEHSYADIRWQILEATGFPSRLGILERKWFDILHPLYWGKEPVKIQPAAKTKRRTNSSSREHSDTRPLREGGRPRQAASSLDHTNKFDVRDDAIVTKRKTPDIADAILDCKDAVSEQDDKVTSPLGSVKDPAGDAVETNGFAAMAAKTIPGPRRLGDGIIRQFSSVDLREKSGEYPFKGVSCDPLVYGDLSSLTLVEDPYSINPPNGHTIVPITGAYGMYGMLAPTKVVSRIGRLPLAVIGKLMIGIYFYKRSTSNGEHEYTVYRPEMDGQLTVIPSDELTDSSSSYINKRMNSFFRIAIMLMEEIGLGYEVDGDAVGIGDHVIVKTQSGVQVMRPLDPSDVIPFAWIKAPRGGVIAQNIDSVLSKQVFASERDYCNFCMGVFYSVMGMDGAHYFIMTDTGGSGKSTLMRGLSSLVPSLATTALQIENLAKTGFERGMTVSQLVNKRIAIQDEVTAIRPTAMRMLNAVSSGTTMEARYGGGVFQYVDLKLALWFAGNTDVELPGIDAVRRRRVDIRLKNALTRYDWEEAVDWDPDHRRLYEVVRSREAFAIMLIKGMKLWSERDGEFFETDSAAGGSTDALAETGVNRLVETVEGLQEHADVADLVMGLTEEDLVRGHVCKSVSLVSRGKSILNALKDNGFETKRTTTTGPDRSKPVTVRYLVVDDETKVRRLQRTLAAYKDLAAMRLSLHDLDNALIASIATGEKTVGDVIETISSDGKEYAVVPVSGPRPSLASMIKRQAGVAPVELIGSGFVRGVLNDLDRPLHRPFVTRVPWSQVEAVEDGLQWALVCGLRRTVDVETGEEWVGGLDAVDSNSSIMQIGSKYAASWL